MSTLFISDLHLSTERPEITHLFLEFLRNEAAQADALYILGDLFEVWIGDDASVSEYRTVIEGLRHLVGSGTPVYVMHGNRDFLMAKGFEEASGSRIIPDPTIIDLYGEPTLLMHGDTLCTDDIEYQRFRSQVRDPARQQQFLSLPPQQRAAIAMDYRAQSREKSSQKAQEIMDVNPQAVENTLREHGVISMIHGHTHRPATHKITVDGKTAQRTVLGDWYHQGSVLTCSDTGCDLTTYYI
ncbi:MAG: UDP-2,3-diacylglucosamine diphosphatase [Gammaproteobacteria bacterium]